jgi:hypothetical protein
LERFTKSKIWTDLHEPLVQALLLAAVQRIRQSPELLDELFKLPEEEFVAKIEDAVQSLFEQGLKDIVALDRDKVKRRRDRQRDPAFVERNAAICDALVRAKKKGRRYCDSPINTD